MQVAAELGFDLAARDDEPVKRVRDEEPVPRAVKPARPAAPPPTKKPRPRDDDGAAASRPPARDSVACDVRGAGRRGEVEERRMLYVAAGAGSPAIRSSRQTRTDRVPLVVRVQHPCT